MVYTRAAIEKSQDGLISTDWEPVEETGLTSLDIDTGEDYDLASQLADSPAARRLLPARKGMRIAIVSNCPWWDRDVSAEVESHDLVVRINDLSSLDTGRTGKRTDLAVVLPGDNYLANLAETQHGDALRDAMRVVFARQVAEDPGSKNRMLAAVSRHRISRWAVSEEGYTSRLHGHTTFFEAMFLCLRYFPGAKITLFGDRAAGVRALEHGGTLGDIEDNETSALVAANDIAWVHPGSQA